MPANRSDLLVPIEHLPPDFQTLFHSYGPEFVQPGRLLFIIACGSSGNYIVLLWAYGHLGSRTPGS